MRKFETDSNNPSFIGGWFIEESVCDDLIGFFNDDTSFPVAPGIVGDGSVVTEIKESIDKPISTLSQDPRILYYLDSLSQVLNLYLDEYKFCNSTSCPWKIVENFNIQWYPRNGGFKTFHFERNGTINSIMRYLTFMTYLNDIDDGGETEFYYQNLKVKPQKGLTLIWPAEWTHTHRGIPSPTEEKMIVTGWYSFT